MNTLCDAIKASWFLPVRQRAYFVDTEDNRQPFQAFAVAVQLFGTEEENLWLAARQVTKSLPPELAQIVFRYLPFSYSGNHLIQPKFAVPTRRKPNVLRWKLPRISTVASNKHIRKKVAEVGKRIAAFELLPPRKDKNGIVLKVELNSYAGFVEVNNNTTVKTLQAILHQTWNISKNALVVLRQGPKHATVLRHDMVVGKVFQHTAMAMWIAEETPMAKRLVVGHDMFVAKANAKFPHVAIVHNSAQLGAIELVRKTNVAVAKSSKASHASAASLLSTREVADRDEQDRRQDQRRAQKKRLEQSQTLQSKNFAVSQQNREARQQERSSLSNTRCIHKSSKTRLALNVE